MGVVKSKNYPLALRDRAWDADAAEDRVRRWAGGPDKENVDWDKYRSCHLWYDSENPENFTSYKLLYCDIIDGEPRVVFRALSAVIAVLNEGRGGVDIPENDREGVYQEAAKQYRRFDEEPPELKRESPGWENRVGAVLNRQNRDKLFQALELIQEVLRSAESEEKSLRSSLPPDMERRAIPAGEIEVRAENDKPGLAGYAVRWDSESANLPFLEVFRRGAFTESLENNNVVALWAHDSAKPLASVEAGNLKIREDDTGLYFEMTPLETSWGKDAIISISSRVVKGMSFGFTVIDDRWGTKDGQSYREVLKAKLFEISPTPFPAYQATSVAVREIFKSAGIDFDGLSDVFSRAQRGLPLATADHDLIKASIEILRGYLPAGSRQGPDSAADGGKPQGRLALLRRRLELLERAT